MELAPFSKRLERFSSDGRGLFYTVLRFCALSECYVILQSSELHPQAETYFSYFGGEPSL